MKIGTATGLLLLVAQVAASTSRPSCNVELLESYDLPTQADPIPDKLVFCPSVSSNCCSYQTQLAIYKKWVLQGERDKLFEFYSAYRRHLALVFDFFDQTELIAKRMLDLTEDFEASNCKLMASLVQRYRFSVLKEEVLNSLTRAFKHFYFARQGFYCSLCDAANAKYLWVQEEGFQVSEKACAATVRDTLNFYLFKQTAFIKAARLYAKLLVSCDARGNFHGQRLVPEEVKFYRKDEFGAEIEDCRKEFDGPRGFASCSGYCGRFNPVRFDRFFEGELDKVATFASFLGKKTNALAARMGLPAFRAEDHPGNDDFAFIERLLGDGQSGGRAGADGLLLLNKEYKTKLLRTLTYSFANDASLTLKTNFDESIMGLSQSPRTDFMDYQCVVGEKGIDFHEQGKEAIIDYKTAMIVFQRVNPQAVVTKQELDDKLMK